MRKTTSPQRVQLFSISPFPKCIIITCLLVPVYGIFYTVWYINLFDR